MPEEWRIESALNRLRSAPVTTAWRSCSIVSLASAMMVGCSGSEFVSERPVSNQIPPLKAGVYSVSAVDVRPVATRDIEPDFPYELGSILSGKATVVFTVRADGKVADESIVEADDVLFGEAALAAIQKWRFRPAQVKGAPVDCRMTLPFIFMSPFGGNIWDESPPVPSNGAPPDKTNKTDIEPH
jgi:TonB family protein